jgi:hypothetical protein
VLVADALLELCRQSIRCGSIRLSLSGDIAAHLSGLYGVEVGRDTISRVTDAVLEDVLAWRTRPLEAVYPIMYSTR